MCEATMRAWVLEEKGVLRRRLVPIPVPARDEVLVRIDAACICNIRHFDGFDAVAEKHLGADLNCTLNPLCFETFLRMLIFHLTNLLFCDRLYIKYDSMAIIPY